jgi:hypothetical protein
VAQDVSPLPCDKCSFRLFRHTDEIKKEEVLVDKSYIFIALAEYTSEQINKVIIAGSGEC